MAVYDDADAVCLACTVWLLYLSLPSLSLSFQYLVGLAFDLKLNIDAATPTVRCRRCEDERR